MAESSQQAKQTMEIASLEPVKEGAPWATIAVMGVTGSGKSTFIKTVSGDETVEVGDTMTSCTSDLKGYSFHYAGHNITLVDSPGFNDTFRSETDVLKDIAKWLEDSYAANKNKLSGIIYLHGVNHVKMEGSALRNLRMFRELCGPDPLKNIVLTTTFWDGTDQAVKERREKELAETPEFWGSMLKRGSSMARFTDLASGRAIIASLLSLEPEALQIQRELVDEEKKLINTGAGQILNKELADMEARHERERQQAAEELKAALEARDQEVANIILQEQEKLEAELEKIHRQQRQLAAEDRAHYRRMQNQHDDQLWALREQHNQTNSMLQQQISDLKKYNEDAQKRWADLDVDQIIAKIRLEESKLRDEERLRLELEIEKLKRENQQHVEEDSSLTSEQKMSKAKKIGKVFITGLRMILPLASLLTIGVPIGGGVFSDGGAFNFSSGGTLFS